MDRLLPPGFLGKVWVAKSPWVDQLQALRKISHHDNVLAGTVPWVPSQSQRGLPLQQLALSDSIPPSIGNYPLLQTLDLSNISHWENPSQCCKLNHAIQTQSSFNSLMGSIPNSLTRSPSLTILALQQKNISWGRLGHPLRVW